MGATRDGEERRGGDGCQERGPGGQFVGVVGNYKCSGGKDAVVPDWSFWALFVLVVWFKRGEVVREYSAVGVVDG